MFSPKSPNFRTIPKVLVAVLAVLGLLSSCSDSAEPLSEDVIALFDVANNAIADLSPEGSEDVPRNQMMQSVLRAKEAGTNLRIVVASPDGEFVSAKSVVDRYGGTAIAYQADRTNFEGASRDISGSQLNRAVDAAKVELDMGQSAAAFVGVLESEGLEAPGRSSGRTALLILLAVAAIFMLSGAWSYLRARRRRQKRHDDFVSRKTVLTDWASQLSPEVEALRPMVAASPDDGAQQVWHDSQEFVSSIVPTLDAATTAGELDVAEMRIGRTAIKLRDLRRSLEET